MRNRNSIRAPTARAAACVCRTYCNAFKFDGMPGTMLSIYCSGSRVDFRLGFLVAQAETLREFRYGLCVFYSLHLRFKNISRADTEIECTRRGFHDAGCTASAKHNLPWLDGASNS